MSLLGLMLMLASGVLQLIALAQILNLNFAGALAWSVWGLCFGIAGVAFLSAGEKASEHRLNETLSRLNAARGDSDNVEV
jgi:hypothetical protein